MHNNHVHVHVCNSLFLYHQMLHKQYRPYPPRYIPDPAPDTVHSPLHYHSHSVGIK